VTGERRLAPAKLTLSLAVTGVRPDGYHELAAEMVALDLADELWIDPSGDSLTAEAVDGVDLTGLSLGPDNLVRRALAAAGRRAGVHLVKRIPLGGGLGGGSADAGAVLRWAGVEDRSVAAGLGADVPFTVSGGRAWVTGVGERVAPMPFEARSFTLLIPPLAVDTAAVYRHWDVLRASGAARPARPGGNDLTEAALAVAPELARWRDELARATGHEPRLAGSGATWFVDGPPDEVGLAGRPHLALDGRPPGRLVGARTVPVGWEGVDR
jgi:4-diphosphocytidyl-2-C-methyl-D-erythritol kinase